MLTCRNAKESKKAIVWTAIINFPIVLLFLAVGAALFAFYQVSPDANVDAYIAAKHTDYIFPHFIKTVLGPGMRGILIAALLAAAMSSLDSALNALSSSAYIDIYRNYIRPNADEKTAVKISRRLVFFFAALLVIIAMVFGRAESILWLGYKVWGYTYGALLGIVLLAVLTKNRGRDWSNAAAMLSSIFVVVILTQPGRIAWPWALAIGTLWTFAIGCLASKKPQLQAAEAN
jgi:Na+/proline symporter